MLKSQGIKALGEAGRSEREIAQVMGVSRGAVRRHLGREESNRTKAPTGSSPDSTSGIDKSRSRCEGLQDQILEKLDRGLTAIRIHQDLRAEHGFTGTYSSVRRYVQQLKARSEAPFRRMETPPAGAQRKDGTNIRSRV